MDDSRQEIEKGSTYPNWKQSGILMIMVLVLQFLFGLIIGVFIYLATAVFEFSLERAMTKVLLLGLVLSNMVVIKFALNRTDYELFSLFREGKNKLISYMGTFFLITGWWFLATEVLNFLVRLFPASLETLEKLEEIMANNGLIFSVLSIVIVPSIMEEIIFRGIILKGLLKNYGPKFAIFFSALLFGFAHFNILQGVSAFLIAIILGWLYWKYGSLLLVIFAHAVNNLLSVVFYHYVDSYDYLADKEIYFEQPLWLTITGVVLVIGGILINYINSEKKNHNNLAG